MSSGRSKFTRTCRSSSSLPAATDLHHRPITSVQRAGPRPLARSDRHASRRPSVVENRHERALSSLVTVASARVGQSACSEMARTASMTSFLRPCSASQMRSRWTRNECSFERRSASNRSVEGSVQRDLCESAATNRPLSLIRIASNPRPARRNPNGSDEPVGSSPAAKAATSVSMRSATARAHASGDSAGCHRKSRQIVFSDRLCDRLGFSLDALAYSGP